MKLKIFPRDFEQGYSRKVALILWFLPIWFIYLIAGIITGIFERQNEFWEDFSKAWKK